MALRKKGYSFRGAPGTHDVELGVRIFQELRKSTNDTRVNLPVFDKGTDDRGEPRVIQGKVGVVLFEGLFVGANTAVDPSQLSDGFKKEVAEALRGYQDLFGMLDDLIVRPYHDLSIIKQMYREQILCDFQKVRRQGKKWFGISLKDVDLHIEAEHLSPWQKGVSSPEPLFEDASVIMHTDVKRKVTLVEFGGRGLAFDQASVRGVYPKLTGTHRNNDANDLGTSPALLRLLRKGGFVIPVQFRYVNIGLGFRPFDTREFIETWQRAWFCEVKPYATELPGMVALGHIRFSHKSMIDEFKTMAQFFLKGATRVPLDDVFEVILLISSSGTPYDAGIAEIVVAYRKEQETMYRTLVIAPHLQYVRRGVRKHLSSKHKAFFREVIHKYFGVDNLWNLIQEAKKAQDGKIMVEFDVQQRQWGKVVKSLGNKRGLIIELNPTEKELEQFGAHLLETRDIVKSGLTKMHWITAYQVVFHMTTEEENGFLSMAECALDEGGVLEIKNIITGQTSQQDPKFYEISFYQKRQGQLVYLGSVTSDYTCRLFTQEDDFKRHWEMFGKRFRRNRLNKEGIKFLFSEDFAKREGLLLIYQRIISSEEIERLKPLVHSIHIDTTRFWELLRRAECRESVPRLYRRAASEEILQERRRLYMQIIVKACEWIGLEMKGIFVDYDLAFSQGGVLERTIPVQDVEVLGFKIREIPVDNLYWLLEGYHILRKASLILATIGDFQDIQDGKDEESFRGRNLWNAQAALSGAMVLAEVYRNAIREGSFAPRLPQDYFYYGFAQGILDEWERIEKLRRSQSLNADFLWGVPVVLLVVVLWVISELMKLMGSDLNNFFVLNNLVVNWRNP